MDSTLEAHFFVIDCINIPQQLVKPAIVSASLSHLTQEQGIVTGPSRAKRLRGYVLGIDARLVYMT